MIPAKSKYHCLIIAGLLLLLSGCLSDSIRPYENKLKSGDLLDWVNKSWNDQNWKNANGTDTKGIFWLRFHFKLQSPKNIGQPYGVQIIALGSYDAYWDGQLIGKNGLVGKTKALEVPGEGTEKVPVLAA